MAEPDHVLLGRAEIERAFTALGERLTRRRAVADVFVVGGAAMALAYDTARVIRDVDDLRLLAGVIRVNSADAALQICADFYPDEPVSPEIGCCAPRAFRLTYRRAERLADLASFQTT